MRERIKTPPAPEVVEYVLKPGTLKYLDRDYPLLMWVNKAHALMLVRRQVLTPEVGKTLLAAILEMGSDGIEKFTYDPALEELYLNFEHQLIQKVGADAGGRLHTGRSRNDLFSTTTRMAARNALTSFLASLMDLRQVLLDVAREHVDTVMPGYTHLQPAQPTTFGHYLASFSLAIQRDAERLAEVYPRLNLSPLGAGAFAGTGFPIDRDMTARLLGFDGIVESTLDAVASRDYVSELLSAMAILAVTISRLAQDIYLWCSDEWNTVEVADEVAATSSIMPQKKNPTPLEHVKGKAGQVMGALVASLAAQKNVNFMHCRDIAGESVDPLWGAFEQAEAMVHLTRKTMQGLQVRKELMRRRAAEDFSTATELADSLVREAGLPFRTAHAIVGNVVTLALDRGLRFDAVSPELVDEAARELTGRPIGLTQDQVESAIDPVRNLEGKRAAGSPAPSETRRLIDVAAQSLDAHRRLVEEWGRRLQDARDDLERQTTELIEGK
jgi:argininosuccinate lyase